MILGIDHVGLLTADPEGVGALLAVLGLSKVDGGAADDYGVSCDFWQVGADPAAPAVEVVAPTREDSAVAGRLARGPGLYHVAFEVDDLRAEASRLRANGFALVDAEPCRGARDGMAVQYLYAPKPAGVLVELVHYATARRGLSRPSGIPIGAPPETGH
ncbi:VOC family protein [Actinosynnema sp. NPDC049800]